MTVTRSSIDAVAEELWKVVNMGGFSWEWLVENRPERASELRFQAAYIINKAGLVSIDMWPTRWDTPLLDLSLKEALVTPQK